MDIIPTMISSELACPTLRYLGDSVLQPYCLGRRIPASDNLPVDRQYEQCPVYFLQPDLEMIRQFNAIASQRQTITLKTGYHTTDMREVDDIRELLQSIDPNALYYGLAGGRQAGKVWKESGNALYDIDLIVVTLRQCGDWRVETGRQSRTPIDLFIAHPYVLLNNPRGMSRRVFENSVRLQI
jgi:hypothetical protein